MSEPADKQPPGVRAVGWLIVGALLTLGIVVALRHSTPETAVRPIPSASPTSLQAAAPSSDARAEFAQLYLDYLLKTYYVYERGFCTALLKEICEALLKTHLVTTAATCAKVPNAALVLAIGRYQHQTGLPVDGKAGPETVRRMLGGDFVGRPGMAEKYCPGWRPAATTTPASSAPAATVAW